MWRLMQCGELWTGVHTLSVIACALLVDACCACLVLAWLGQASHCSPHLTDHIYVACANFVVALALLSLAVVNGFKASQPVA